MKIVIFALLIIFLLITLFLFKLLRSSRSILDEPFYSGPTQTYCKNTRCGMTPDELNDSHLLIPSNLPHEKPEYATVSCTRSTKEDQIAPESGLWNFGKPQLLYDGIWKETIKYKGKDQAKNEWRLIPKGYKCLDQSSRTYGSNKLFNIRNLPIDGMPVPVDNCSEIISRDVQISGYCPMPDEEDILGYKMS